MKILIIGSINTISENIFSYLKNYHDTYIIYNHNFDLQNRSKVSKCINEINPDIVIHSLDFADIESCEKSQDKAYAFNTITTLNIAHPCSTLNIPIVYISTNYVFDGNSNSPYLENDEPNPINIYGKTKLAAENLIRTLCNKYFILRTSCVFGGKNCFVDKVLSNLNAPIFMCSSEISSITYVEDLCKCINELIVTDKYGIYNCVNSEEVSKSTFTRKVFDILSINKSLIELPPNFFESYAPRPKYSALDNSLIKNTLSLEIPPWEDRLNHYLHLRNL